MSERLGDVRVAQTKPAETPPAPGKHLPSWMKPTGVVKKALMLEKRKKRLKRRKKLLRKLKKHSGKH